MFKSKASKASRAAEKQPVFKQDYINDNHRTYSCVHCRAHLANHDELISKLFQGNHGRAYLFNKVLNVGCRQAVQRELLTGLHAVADIYCAICDTTLGWKYEQAFVPSQKYKEGKYIIEVVHMLKENHWDLTSYNAHELLSESLAPPAPQTTSAPAIAKWNPTDSMGDRLRVDPADGDRNPNGPNTVGRQTARVGANAEALVLRPADPASARMDQSELDKQISENDRLNLGLNNNKIANGDTDNSKQDRIELVDRTLMEIQLNGGQRIVGPQASSNGYNNTVSSNTNNTNNNNNSGKSDSCSNGNSDDSDHANCISLKSKGSRQAISTKSSLCSTCSQMDCLDSSCSTSQMESSISVNDSS